MRQAILDFPKQFAFVPVIENAPALAPKPYALLSGMGGSHLAADILKAADPSVMLYVHSTYGLPAWPKDHFSASLFIASSYSGNTEEVIDGYEAAGKIGMQRAVIAVGGKLLDMAKRDGVPYVQLPNTGIQPRSALGFNALAVAALLRRDDLTSALASLATMLDASAHAEHGKKIAQALTRTIPIIYASVANQAIAANWKIKINETGKSPAFYNVFPELNHNEMTGFDTRSVDAPPSDRFAFIFLRDSEDHPRIQRRMEVTAKLYRDRGFSVHELVLEGKTRFEKMCSALLVADWTALHIAEQYGLESEQVPMVEEMKRLI